MTELCEVESQLAVPVLQLLFIYLLLEIFWTKHDDIFQFSRKKKSSKKPDTEKAIAKFTVVDKNIDCIFKNTGFFWFVSVKNAERNIRIPCETNLGLVLSWSCVDTKCP